MSIHRAVLAWVALVGMVAAAMAQSDAAERQRTERLWTQHWKEFAAFYLEHEGRFVCFSSFDRAHPNSRGLTAKDYARQSVREFTVRDDKGRDVQKPFTKPQGDVDVVVKSVPQLEAGQYGYIHSGMVESIAGPDTVVLRNVWLVDSEKVRVEHEAAQAELVRQAGRDIEDAMRDRDRRGPRVWDRHLREREQLDWQFEERNSAIRRQGRWSESQWRVIGFDTKSLVTGRRWPAGVSGGTSGATSGGGGDGIQVAILEAGGGSVVAVPASRLGKGVSEEQFKKVLEQRGLSVDRFIEILTEQKKTNPLRYRNAVLAAIEDKSPDAPAAPNTEVREVDG